MLLYNFAVIMVCIIIMIYRYKSESGEPSSLFCAKAGMLARVLVCNYTRFPMNTISS